METEVQLQNPILEEHETALLSNRRQDHILVDSAMDSSHVVVIQVNLLEDFVGNGNQLCDRDSTVGSSIGGSDIDAIELVYNVYLLCYLLFIFKLCLFLGTYPCCRKVLMLL